MKTLVLLFLTGICSAAIAPVGGAKVNFTFVTSQSLSYSPTAGNVVVVFVSTNSQSSAYCRDNNFHTYFPGPTSSSGTSVEFSFYAFASSGTTAINCLWPSQVSGTIQLEEYSGASSVNVGLTGNSANGSSGTATLSVTTQDNNDYVVFGLSDKSNTLTTTVGTQRQNSSSTASQALIDATSGTPALVTATATLTSSNWNALAIELRTTTPPAGVWSLIQLTPAGLFQCQPNGSTFFDICTFQIAPLVAGDQAFMGMVNNFDGVSQPQRTLITMSDCTAADLDGSGNCTLSRTTWTLCGVNCQAYASSSSHTLSVDGGYSNSVVGGGTFITFTRSGHNATIMERFEGALIEVASTQANSLDTVQAASDSTATNTHTLTNATILGSNDAIIQSFGGGSGQTSVTSPYTGVFDNHFAWAVSLNTNNGAAPTWTSGGLAFGVGNVIAWKAFGSGSSKCNACDMSEVIFPW